MHRARERANWPKRKPRPPLRSCGSWRLSANGAEDSLQESEERFRFAAETANDLIYEWDLKQSVQWLGDIDGLLGS